MHELENFLPAAMESSSPPKEPKCMLFPPQMLFSEGKLVPVSTFIFCLDGCNGGKSKKAFKMFLLFLQKTYQNDHHLLPEKECMSW